MIWKLTKTIYIIVFLIINIVFLMILLNQHDEDPGSSLSSSKSLRSTNIDTSGLPEYQNEKMNIMQAEMYRFKAGEANGETFNQTTEVLRHIDDVPFENGYLKKYMEESVYRGSEYEYDEITSKDKSVIFTQMVNGKPVFNHRNARVRFLQKDGEKIMEQSYLTNFTDNEFSKAETVRNPLHIVEELYQNDSISEDAKILDATLGYYIIVVEEELSQVVMRPKWQLVIEEKDMTRVIYIDAISLSEKIIEKE